VTEIVRAPAAPKPWQLRLYEKSLKKKQKLALLLRMLGAPRPTERLLLLTNGDNNGAMNYVFRQHGGAWTWAECEKAPIPEMEAFLGERVVHCSPERLDLPSESFDTIVVIDVNEHLVDPSAFNRELFRIVKPGGRAIVTVPNGDSKKLAIRIKNLVGMTKETYGHVVDGYTIPQLREQLVAAGFQPRAEGSYANFFTEMVELAINFAYVKLLSRKGTAAGEHGPIAPSSADQVRKVEKTLRIYGLLYPFCRAFSALDALLDPFTTGYAVAVACEKPRA
jgi:SAM-dependent methyltransferase